MIPRYLSYSQLKEWQACRRLWAYRYRDEYRPKVPPLAFMRGSLIHLGMEHGIDTFDLDGGFDEAWTTFALETWLAEWKIVPEQWFGYDEFVAGCKVIVEGALRTFHEEWELLSDEHGRLLERRFYMDLPGWKGLVFIPDAVCRKRREPFAGGTFGVDFKSFGKPKEELAGELDLQGAIYQHGLRVKGHDVIGTCLFQIAAAPPKTARTNKDGSANKTDERSIINWKAVNGQIVTYRSPEFLEGIWNQIVLPLAFEIALAEGGDDSGLVPHLTYYGCKWCAFRAPCLARLKGQDEAAILADQFRQRRKGV